eukprot:Gregarina_sp_Poly_1__1519@NODE_1381_length_4253_cov_250_831104_g925_i0_p1_GENE_NODE_1381_length_4253_cov_250_831104_g925_i0NODE_1381_length_4253_cov_250_831104_g925_i0_p1_ORF_typecomplete_len431_score94_62TMV_coat/PF00721_21/1_2e02TMV_coat/PF00721_21/1_6TMV_coat/PF00721_21/2_6e03TMV_coat/PF00721_21/1_3e03Pneumo_M2/PF07380_11/1_9e03Pneumo_M2/PF07380_11/5_5e02Pneumo_M2/PF07380_11/9_8_NODE_1381_length_4253_cov_250_831104_g925_i022863578
MTSKAQENINAFREELFRYYEQEQTNKEQAKQLKSDLESLIRRRDEMALEYRSTSQKYLNATHRLNQLLQQVIAAEQARTVVAQARGSMELVIGSCNHHKSIKNQFCGVKAAYATRVASVSKWMEEAKVSWALLESLSNTVTNLKNSQQVTQKHLEEQKAKLNGLIKEAAERQTSLTSSMSQVQSLRSVYREHELVRNAKAEEEATRSQVLSSERERLKTSKALLMDRSSFLDWVQCKLSQIRSEIREESALKEELTSLCSNSSTLETEAQFYKDDHQSRQQSLDALHLRHAKLLEQQQQIVRVLDEILRKQNVEETRQQQLLQEKSAKLVAISMKKNEVQVASVSLEAAKKSAEQRRVLQQFKMDLLKDSESSRLESVAQLEQMAANHKTTQVELGQEIKQLESVKSLQKKKTDLQQHLGVISADINSK